MCHVIKTCSYKCFLLYWNKNAFNSELVIESLIYKVQYFFPTLIANSNDSLECKKSSILNMKTAAAALCALMQYFLSFQPIFNTSIPSIMWITTPLSYTIIFVPSLCNKMLKMYAWTCTELKIQLFSSSAG